MRYYKRIFFLLLVISTTGIALAAGILLWNTASKTRRDFYMTAENTLRSLAEYTDNRLSTAQLYTHILSSSEYMYQYINKIPPEDYNRFKLFEYAAAIYNIISAQQTRSAIVFFETDYVILNDHTSPVDMFAPLFYLTHTHLEHMRAFFDENPWESGLLLPVTSPEGLPYIVYVRCEKYRFARPLFFFSLFAENQLFDSRMIAGGTMRLFYNGNLLYETERAQKKSNTGKALTLRMPSALFGYSYEYRLPEEKPITRPLVIISLTGLLCILAASLVAYALARRLYRPVEGLMRLTRQQPSADDEFEALRNAILGLYDNIAKMSGTLENYNTVLENNFFAELMTGYIPPSELKKHLQQFNLERETGTFCVIALTFEQETSLTSDFSYNELYLLKQNVLPILQKAFSVFGFYRLVNLSFDTTAAVLKAEHVKHATEMLKTILLRQETEFTLEFTAAAGVQCDSLETIGVSYRSAARLLEINRYNGGTEKVISADDLNGVPGGGKTAYYSLNTEQTLINAVLHGKDEIRNAMLCDIFSNIRSGQSESIPQIALMLTATLQRITDILQKSPEDFFSRDIPLYVELATCTTIPELQKKACELFAQVSRGIKTGGTGINQALVQGMLSFIGENYTRDISLDDMAEAVHLSPNYVSTVFKNAVGINFKEYLNRHRYTVACRIIDEQPYRKIKEVAAATGCSTEILSRLFMRYAGMLPTAYQTAAVLAHTGKKN